VAICIQKRLSIIALFLESCKVIEATQVVVWSKKKLASGGQAARHFFVPSTWKSFPGGHLSTHCFVPSASSTKNFAHEAGSVVSIRGFPAADSVSTPRRFPAVTGEMVEQYPNAKAATLHFDRK